jgi:hypothetical protein
VRGPTPSCVRKATGVTDRTVEVPPLAGVQERGTLSTGSPGTWEDFLPPEETCGGVNRDNKQTGPRGRPDCAAPRRYETEQSARVPVTKGQPEGAGTGREESECLMVPMKQGNPPRGTLWRDGGTGTRNRWRERWREHRDSIPSPRNCNG